MRKILYILFALCLCIGSSGCGNRSEFRVKGFEEDKYSPIINIYLEYDVTMTTLNIESEIKDWNLIKKEIREDYWSFSEDISKPNEIIRVDGSYDKSINIYLEQNSSENVRASHITVYYAGKHRKIIQIIQNYKPY
ncbi:hypothetical protein M2451_001801 [Dysgonomonas sp. PFB1-18]|uniref:hypothetical protein n=1 Tax=unclassified Dysgonomonas TaxID=2630389 RepID=UPI002474E3BD|nr:MULTISPECIES: hypothetical protein [unclassified Dysgonomonas]MDH6309230.1 hypothetical protein [Dysgonomonas sp. PF1-14]MDH6338890.1 hypothetical protein [Dysgonomonas sp. PF1-16]MDH6380479.1 hypothetical protein [Dysgonomonas sp. PFB1-18]MDH6397718.1 hypothetical protein [Dysgonomonas sp. PF1-23]